MQTAIIIVAKAEKIVKIFQGENPKIKNNFISAAKRISYEGSTSIITQPINSIGLMCALLPLKYQEIEGIKD